MELRIQYKIKVSIHTHINMCLYEFQKICFANN